MPTAFSLAPLGINGDVTIEGTFEILRHVHDAPVLFLLMEHHTTPASITQNIAAAEELVARASVILLGAESHEWEDNIPANEHIEFFEHFRDRPGLNVVGIESKPLLDAMEADVAEPPLGNWPGITIPQHPFNTVRSYFFLASTFRYRRINKIEHNAIINAGGKHIDDICRIALNGEADILTGGPVSYVRVKPTAYPARSG